MQPETAVPGSLIIAPWDALAERLADALAPHIETLRFLQPGQAPPVVIVPGASVTSAVVEQLARRFPDGFPLPDFVTPESLASRLVASTLPAQTSRSMRALLMRAACDAASKDDDAILRSPRCGTLALRSWRDVLDSGVDPWSIAKRASARQSRILEPIERAWRGYVSLLRSRGLADPAQIMRSATSALKERPLECFAVYGFYDATGLQTSLLRAVLAGSPAATLYVPGRAAEGEFCAGYEFARRFVLALDRSPANAACIAPASTTLTAASFASAREEADATCDAIRELLDSGTGSDRIAITARAFTAPQLEVWSRAAARRSITLNLTTTLPLVQTRAGRVVRLLMSIEGDGWPRSQVVELIEGGLKPLESFRGTSARIDHDARRRNIAGGDPARLQAHAAGDEQLAPYVTALRAIEAIASGIPERAAAAAWGDRIVRWRELLAPEHEIDLPALSEIDAIVDALDALGDTPVTRASVIEMIEGAHVTFDRERSGVWIGDFMQIRGRTFDSVFITGTDATRLPQQRTPDPVVPDDLRERTGVRRIGDGRDEESMLFRLIVDSSRGVTLSWSRKDDAGGELQASPLITSELTARFPREQAVILGRTAKFVSERFPMARRDRAFAVEERHRILRDPSHPMPEPVAASLTAAAAAGMGGVHDGYLSGDALPPERIAALLETSSPTALEHYGSCPHRFMLHAVLNIRDLDDPVDSLDLNPRDKGTLQHRVMEVLYRERLDELLELAQSGHPRARLRPLVAGAVDAAFDEDADKRPPHRTVFRRIAAEQMTEALLTSIIDDLRNMLTTGFRPQEYEYTFGSVRDRETERPAVSLAFGPLSVQVRGSIDRIDFAEDGRVRIVDYKSSSRSYEKLEEHVLEGRQLQLVLYCKAWQALHGTPAELLSAMILPLDGKPPKRDKLSFELSAVRERIDHLLMRFGEGISGRRFPAFPGDHCKYCAVAEYCRSAHDPIEKVRLASHGTAAALLWPGDDPA